MIKPKSIWWNYADVINWVFTRNLRLLNLAVVDQQQHPRTKRYALEELRLPDGSPLLSKEGEVEVRARLLGERDQSELSLVDTRASWRLITTCTKAGSRPPITNCDTRRDGDGN